MPITFSLADEVPAGADAVGAPVFEGLVVPPGAGADLDLVFLAERGFEGKPGEALAVPSGRGTWVALGMGKPEEVTAETLRRAAAAFVRKAWKDRTVATTLLAAAPPELDRARAAQAVAEGASMAAYRFGRYKADPKPCLIESLTVVGTGDDARHGVDRGARIAAAVALARDLVNEPAKAMTPRRLAEMAAEVADAEGLTLTVLDEVAIEAERLGGLAGVAAGSDEPARLIELVYDPPSPEGAVALVGKGITFDSGGLSIKTAEGMETMKTDKSGAAAVLGAMSVIAALAPPVKVVGIIPATENMPGGSALKPGDVLTARNGKTIEVLNTDAEGRLVLADGLSLAVEAGVDAIIDVATLTGACVVALGRKVAGLMGNHAGWVDQIGQAAARAGEEVWPLPLPEDYRKLIDSDVADVKNVSNGRYAGALTAGLFLREFVGDVPWAHLDIAGPARSEEDEGYLQKGGTGFGVRTLVEAVTSFRKP
ncbi:MAG TPA: leucyl aminopeptidase [Acidimicrobiales bacterium]|nr:leucyl aminopeptidase [Acidimicrobiales bacterium]